MYRIKAHPTAGGIPNVFDGAEPGVLQKNEISYIRELAQKVLMISEKPEQEEKRKQWYLHNALEKTEPMILVFPEDSWYEILNPDTLVVKDMYWRQYEWYLKSLIYRDEHIMDDNVIEPYIYVPSIFTNSGWGLEAQYEKKEQKGSFHWEPPLKELDDIHKLKHPEIIFDREKTYENFHRVSEVFDGILPVRIHGISRFGYDIADVASTLRGIEQLIIDIYDNPEWVEQLFKFISEGYVKNMEWYEANGHLNMNNRNHYTDSGGIGYTHELGTNGDNNTKLENMWGNVVAQAFSEVSPAHHEELLLPYELKILERTGLNAYGCCELLTRKFHYIKRIPNLRRVSVSPWCDIKVAAEQLEDKFIYSWKPNPSYLANGFDAGFIKKYISNTLDVVKDCVVEIILKDTLTLENHPERLKSWIDIIRREIDK